MTAKKKTPLEALREASAKLTLEDREAAIAEGFYLPPVEAESDNEQRWGYRCHDCGDVALRFIGEKWHYHGETYTEPPPSIPCTMLPWTQNATAEHMARTRHRPTCQHCGIAVHMHNGDKFIRRYMIDGIEAYLAQRKEARLTNKERAKANEARANDVEVRGELNDRGDPGRMDTMEHRDQVNQLVEADKAEGFGQRFLAQR